MIRNSIDYVVARAPFGYAFHEIIVDDSGKPLNYRYIDVNQAYEKLTGLKSEDILGKTITDVIPGIVNDSFDWLGFYGEVALNGIDKKFGHYSAVLDRWYHVQVFSPEKGYFTTIFSDITEQVNAKRFLDKIMEHSPDSLWISDKDGTLITMNQACRNNLQVSDEEVVGKYNIFQDNLVFDQGYMPLVREVFDKAVPVRFTLNYNLSDVKSLNLKNGRQFILEVYITPVTDHNGNVTNAIVQHRDITHEKRIADDLLESTKLIENIINTIPAGVFWKDKELTYLGCNKSFALDTGFADPADIIGKNDFQLKWSNRADLYRKDDREVIESETAKLNIEENLTIATGETKNILTNKVPLRNVKGDVIGILGTYLDVTGKKLAEKKIIEKDIKFRKLSANMPDMIYQFTRMKDGSCYVPIASEGIINVFGCTPDDVLDSFEPIIRVLHPDDSERVNREIEYSAKNLTFFNCEFRVKIPGKKIQWILANSTPEKLDDGSVTWFGYCVNITARKLSEIELVRSRQIIEESELRLSIALESSKSGMYDWDILSDSFYWSDEFLRIFGMPHDTIPGFESWTKALHPDDVQAASERIQFSIDNHVDLVNDYRIILPSKEVRWIRALGKTFYIGEKPSRVIGLCLDITTIKQSEQEFKDAKDFAEQNEQKFRLLFNTLTEGVALNEVIRDDQGEMVDYRIIEVNKAYLELTGTKSEQVIGNVASRLYNLQPEFIRAFWYNHKLKHETAYSEMPDPTGKRFFYVATSPFVNDQFVTSFFEITGLKQVELKLEEQNQQLIRAKERAEESDRLKSAFLANMSHEIRTPMNGILGFAELLKEPHLAGEEQQSYIQIIEKSGHRMLNIINDIVDISKIESGQMIVSTQESNINEQIGYLYNFFKPETEQKGIRLSVTCSVPMKDSVILTDREKLFAILTNLIRNAVKYTHQGSIEFGYIKKDDFAEFFVKDTGIGIPENRQQAIFDRFVQADVADTNAFQGAGLGLSISKAYVAMLGGNIWVSSVVGTGTTFFFTIPWRQAIPEQTLNEYKPAKEEPEPTYMIEKILIVEDDIDSQFLLKFMLKKFGNEILVASSGSEALSLFRANPDIELILMDLRIPDINGIEVTRKIREINNQVIILAETAYSLSGDTEAAIEAGCNDYMLKPINNQSLSEKIDMYFVRNYSRNIKSGQV